MPPFAQSDTLPEGGGYVAAAYLVFLALVIVYVAIMASKLARTERDLAELNELADRRLGHPDEPREREGTAA
jgi:hypothetical protein